VVEVKTVTAENTEKKGCTLFGKKYSNRREHREDTEYTENKLCALCGKKQ
jgi:hypothetical protein